MPSRTHHPPLFAPPHRITCAAVLTLTLALTAAGPAAAPAAPPLADDPRDLAWTLAVWGHVPGKADAALETVASIPYWRAANALRGKEIVKDRRFLTRALVLHTDLAIVQRQAAERGQLRPIAGVSGGSFVVEDGSATGRRHGSPHWSVAGQIAVILATWRAPDAHPDDPPHPESRRVARAWFHTVNALFLHWAEGTLRYADLGLRHYPDDAGLHLHRGIVHQMYADGRVQQVRSGSADVRGAYGAPEAASVELARAETDLRRALELDPALAQARIRLAHVVGERGHPREASALAEEALRGTLPRFFEVYATLILGRNLTRQGRLDEARAAFERAAVLAPAAQAARVGRSQVALAAGRPTDALKALTDFLGPGRHVRNDVEEWATYFRVHDPTAAVQLAALRAEFR
jgi:Tfp pilus assembly protein PilF